MSKFKKVLAISLILSFVNSCLSISASDTKFYEDVSLFTYDCNNGLVIEEVYTCMVNDTSVYSTPASQTANSRSLVPGDGEGDSRFQVNAELEPYSRVGDIYLEWDFEHDGIVDQITHSGTGFMVGPDVMMTAAHVVYWKDESKWDANSVATLNYFADTVYYVTKRNGENDYEEIAYSTNITISQAYTTPVDTQNHDWAIVQLNTNVGDRTGWSNIGITNGSLNDNYFMVTGYPDDVGKKYSQWASTGFVEVTDSSLFWYALDTSGGQSGAPVFDSLGTVWGIHIVGSVPRNGAYRFSTTVYGIVQQKITESLERYPR